MSFGVEAVEAVEDSAVAAVLAAATPAAVADSAVLTAAIPVAAERRPVGSWGLGNGP